jgi:hypothetical protein
MSKSYKKVNYSDNSNRNKVNDFKRRKKQIKESYEQEDIYESVKNVNKDYKNK